MVTKKILLCISGSIAAYKSIFLARLCKKAGYDVKVVFSENAHHFVTPLTLQAISGHPVEQDMFSTSSSRGMEHIDLAKWADIILLAPASAEIIAELAHGFAKSLISTICLATHAQIFIIPAMNQEMYRKEVVQNNLRLLKGFGYEIVASPSGEQACGDVGYGRMSEPEDILHLIENFFSLQEICSSQNIKVLLTAGPTYEYLDPVRFLGNRSSGKMGFALADAFQELGCKVSVVQGPTTYTPQNMVTYKVVSAQEMYTKVMELIEEHDIFVSCAAVADYRPQKKSFQKIKKASQEEFSLVLLKNPDILNSVAHLKTKRPFCVGFAAETEQLTTYALEKLVKKNLDMLCLNDVSRNDIGFNSQDNELSVYLRSKKKIEFPKTTKEILAKDLAKEIIHQFSLTLKENT